MFDIGWTELLVVAVVAILVVGPKDLPGMLRGFGRTVGNLRRMASEFQGQFSEALREAETQAGLDDTKKSMSGLGDINPLKGIKDSLNPLKDIGKDVNSGLNSKPQTKSNPVPGWSSETSGAEKPEAGAADSPGTGETANTAQPAGAAMAGVKSDAPAGASTSVEAADAQKADKA